MKIVIGRYNRDGYEILMADGRVLHSAGANAQDAYAPGRDVSLRTLRSWCIKTGREIAAERGEKWGGEERVEEEA